jgi:hypothetical protein
MRENEFIFIPGENDFSKRHHYFDERNYIREVNDAIDRSGSMGDCKPNIQDILKYHINRFRKIIKTNKPYMPNEVVEYFLENPIYVIKNLYEGKTCPRLSEKFWLFLK